MCGVVGLLHKDGAPVDPEVIETMTRAVAHRGPDGAGTWLDGAVGLGHRRLAIIDLETGNQPMSIDHGRLWISYNGEVYNYRQLADELTGAGHRIRTSSDTEVILHAYRQWGPDCVHRLRGMFAFAIVDLDRRRLFLARDQLGIKPLFYADSPRLFAFASELQAFHQVPGLELDLHLESVEQYLHLQYVPAPSTVYRQIHKLPPGHRLVLDLDRPEVEPERYWHLEFAPDRSLSEAQWLELLDHTLEQSVKAHLVADVPFGAFLSGGVDSSAVVATMAQLLDRPVRTFSIGFVEEEFSELGYARQVAEQWATDHHEEVLEPDALGILPTLVQHYGEPFGDPSAVPTYYVARLAARSVPMVLSGDGGDELFAGYHSYRTFLRWAEYEGTATWKRLAYPLLSRVLPSRFPPRSVNIGAWLSFVGVLGDGVRRRLWRPEHRRLSTLVPPCLVEELDRVDRLAPVQQLQAMDINSYLPFAILTKVDVASMISSLEVRTPIVDREVAEVAARIPPELNFGRNPQGQLEGKLLLKRVLSRHYDEAFLHRPKMGFGVPLKRWFAADGSMHDIVRGRLLESRSPLLELFEPAEILRLIQGNAYGPLWLLLVLDEWLRQEAERRRRRPH